MYGAERAQDLEEGVAVPDSPQRAHDASAILIHEGQMIAQLNDVPKIVKAAEEKFAPDVIRIRYHTGFDSSGDPAIFFRVLLSDTASRHENLGKIADRVRRELRDEVRRVGESEHLVYSNFRSKSEQDQLKDPQWE